MEIIFQIYDCRIGKYKLLKGLIELNYSSGARLIVSGPATFELLSESRVRVERGRVTAHMPTIRSRGFVVETPTAVATDLGTEFAIDVGDGHRADDEFHVFNGEVHLQPKSMPQQDSVEMLTGDALRLDHQTITPAGIDIDTTRFVRRFGQVDSLYQRRVMQLKPDVYLPMQVTGQVNSLQDAMALSRRAAVFTKSSDSIHWAHGQVVGSVRYQQIDANPKNKTLSIGTKLDDSGEQPALHNRGFWDGCIDELAIFNRALPATQIAKLNELGRNDK